MNSHRISVEEAASNFIHKHFPQCNAAVLAGSVVRGEATETSDLDIIVFDQRIDSSYRESLVEFGWPIEVFVHSFTSYKKVFESDYERAKPSMQRMIVEGIVLKDDARLHAIKNEAKQMLLEGPEQWTKKVIETKRYFVTDVLEDFIGCTNSSEGIFIANTLAEMLCEFVLRTNQKWIGTSKWVYRALKEYDEAFAKEFVEAFNEYYKNDNKTGVIDLAQSILAPYGGPFFEGFVLGKNS